MKVKIENSFVISSKSLLVLVTDEKLDHLTGMKFVLDSQLQESYPIHSFELVNLSNSESRIGITLKYKTDEELSRMQKFAKDDAVVELI